MKERLLLLYELNKIDKELQEITSLKGDLPQDIEELNERKKELDDKVNDIQTQIAEIENQEKIILKENDELTKRIDKDDNVLRSGGVKTNEEYNALAREIDDAYAHIEKNDGLLEKELRTKKTELNETLVNYQSEMEQLVNELKEKNEELTALNKQTEEEESELNRQREKLIPKIDTEDLDYYERINNVKFGDTFSIVRKGSCLGCFNSIPPQRVIEIRIADRFFNCESCGRILISEEILNN